MNWTVRANLMTVLFTELMIFVTEEKRASSFLPF